MTTFSWIVAGVMVVLLLIAAINGGIGTFLALAGLMGFLTGLYVLITRRSSWAGLPRSRKLGAIVLGAGLVVGIVGSSIGGAQATRETPVAAPAPTVTVTSTVQAPTETVFVTVTAEPVVAPVAEAVPAPDPVSVADPELDAAQQAPAPLYAAPEPAPAAPAPAPQQNVSFANCTEARAAGAAPVHIGDPGYASHLDRDGDGVGCEN
ncbi:excalibur calcium-binding domain-containing protein [Pseudoclavibacter sp. AY1F1]|uniref:excalibur calcium-binding domain-containing protein n=1 Tax=Pseudoclavibacter sp. AY1F1 TaxID=2080583 RepID=UPI0015E2BE36|nr:excalibur calcium-binding domain-containing protein [Pseudoclavibacter sp. AY1F1]